jgi:hypothetical protein
LAFHITVRRLAGPLPPDPPDSADRAALDKWLAQCAVGELYSNPLGADDTVYRWWFLPSQRLSLPLLSRVYPNGLEISDGDLDQLAVELDVLEREWLNSGLKSERPLNWIAVGHDGCRIKGQITLADHLRERAGYLRQAIDAARTQAGVVSIA